jgi:hypothetical protein
MPRIGVGSATNQREHLREEEDDLVDAGPEDAPDAGLVPAPAHIEQEREEQGQRDREQRHGDEEEHVVPEGLVHQLVLEQPDVVVDAHEVLLVRVAAPVGEGVPHRLGERPHHVEREEQYG